MNNFTRTFCLFFIFTRVISVHGQLFKNDADNTPVEYHLQIKQIDEFVKRFNYQIDFMGNKIDRQFERKISRRDYLLLLFNNEDPKLSSESYSSTVNDFIEYTVNLNDDSYINLYDHSTVCTVVFDANYNSVQTDVIICFKPDRLKTGGVKWVINDAIIKGLKSREEKLGFIPPNANETGFMTARQLLNSSEAPVQFADSLFTPDHRTILFHELKNDHLTLNHTKKITYQFTSIPGWKFEVEDFIREGLNSGWLISELEKL